MHSTHVQGKFINFLNNTGLFSENTNRIIKFTEPDKQSLDMMEDKMGELQTHDSSLVSYFNMTNTKTVGGISHSLEKSQFIAKHGQNMTCYAVLHKNRSCDSKDVTLDTRCLFDVQVLNEIKNDVNTLLHDNEIYSWDNSDNPSVVDVDLVIKINWLDLFLIHCYQSEDDEDEFGSGVRPEEKPPFSVQKYKYEWKYPFYSKVQRWLLAIQTVFIYEI